MIMSSQVKFLESKPKNSKESEIKDNLKLGLIDSNAECGLKSFYIALY